MQPEDIIQQKEWHQLTAAEKEIVQRVASSREEYDLLRNMLLVAKEEIDPVPAIDPSIEAFLQAQLQNNTTGKRVIAFRYYAAAAIALLILAAWLLIKKPADTGKVAVLPSVEKIHSTPANKETENKINSTTTKTDPVKEKKPVVKRPVAQKKTDLTINTSIAKDTMLLALVTEVY